jgi:WhiB family redox-sensing transcriptional regulator
MRIYDRKNEEWRLEASCRGMDTNIFFPELGVDIKHIQAIKELCGSCPVNVECLESALNTEMDLYGFYGGKSARQRRTIRSQREWDRNPVRTTRTIHDDESTETLDLECENEKSMA